MNGHTLCSGELAAFSFTDSRSSRRAARHLGQAAKSPKAYWAQEDLEVMTKDFKKELSMFNLNIHWMAFLMLLGKVYFSLLYMFCIYFMAKNLTSIRKS